MHARKGFLKAERGRTAFETLLVLMLVALLFLYAADRFVSSAKDLHEKALVIELSNFRRSINYYTLLNNRLPETLKELVEKKAIIDKDKIEGAKHDMIIGKIAEAVETDKEGYPIDPFGNRYGYDPQTGMIRSSSKGYERW